MSGAKFEVMKFDGQGNFGLWQTRVNDMLVQQGILKALRPTKQHRLYGLEMEDNHDLAQHVNVFNQIISDLAQLDVKIEDEDKAMILLCSLPPSYEYMLTTLTYGKETIKVEEITAALSVNSGSIYLGDDRYCNIVGIGDVIIKMYDCSVQTLCGVRHILDLKKNLISLGTLHKNGFIPKANEDRETIWIVKGALTVMKGKMTAGNIYKLLWSTVVGEVNSVESCDDTTKVWHMGLDHLSECGMAELHKRNMLHGIKSCKLDFCKYCVLGKQNKVRFKTEKHTAEGILDYVHSDVWGPSTTSFLGGSRSPRASLDGKVAEEVGTGHDVTFDHLRIFCCPACVHVPADERSKLDEKSKEYIFLCYKKAKERHDSDGFRAVSIEKTKTSQPTSVGSAMDDFDDPVTFHDDVTSQKKDKWMTAMVEEIKSLNHNRTWELVRLSDVRHTSIRAVFTMVASWDLHLEQMDVKTTFLYSDLEEQIYMQQPEGFAQPGNEHLVCRLKKSLDRDSRKLWPSQRGYVEKMLERFAMSSAKPMSTPLANHFKLSSEQCPKTDKEAEDMAKVSYSNVVGFFMYAMLCTRPDLAHVVSQVCKYMSKPDKQHWKAVKCIFRYLKGTMGHGIVFVSERDNPLVVGYVDSNYAGDLDSRRSTTGYVFTLGGGPICWKSIVQFVVALSTTEAKYMAAAEAAKEALWLTGLVKELGVQQGGVQLLCDNQSTIHLAKNQVYHARTKHIDVRFHKIRELVASGEILFQKVHTNENAADMFTKPGRRPRSMDENIEACLWSFLKPDLNLDSYQVSSEKHVANKWHEKGKFESLKIVPGSKKLNNNAGRSVIEMRGEGSGEYFFDDLNDYYQEMLLSFATGTTFGLKTGGRIESILVSLPLTARWDHKPDEGSEEWKLLAACMNPKEWV
ncbi:Oxygen-dependent coproporphyrinogen-III oxidase [Hibiscus syriacus]|uniref:Oxygen-dependent coproporphyrinogen-III oxidase n=1 Tax=Hibiscus syriacus TaxID=106335 RepID=A0A6A2ZTW4_HIBSY|nr:Oxygen-dependent coproporphyrinogen-III oxidase [Hibiscus syriacus]